MPESHESARDQKHPELLFQPIIASISRELPPQQRFIQLYDAVGKKLNLLVKRWGLGAVVDEEQIQDTAIDFMNDMSASPDENQFLSKLLSICKLRPPHHRKSIEHYASRRLFTLLKRNASESSKDYLKFNESVKKALRRHQKRNILAKIPPEFWSGNFFSKTIPGNADTFSTCVLIRLPLKHKTDSNGRIKRLNLSASVQRLLTNELHLSYRYRSRHISSALYNLLPTPTFSAQRLLNQKEQDSQMLCDCIIESFLAGLPGKQLTKKQCLMAGLAYLTTHQPDLFGQQGILPRHKRIINSKTGEVDKAHKFLNDELLTRALKSAPGRSTAANRISCFKYSLRAALFDCPVIIQQQVMSRLVTLLIAQYKKIVGRIYND